MRVNKEFRRLRRLVFGPGDIDYTALQNCCQVFHYELECNYEKLLGQEDYNKFIRAQNTFAECLKADDFERLP